MTVGLEKDVAAVYLQRVEDLVSKLLRNQHVQSAGAETRADLHYIKGYAKAVREWLVHEEGD